MNLLEFTQQQTLPITDKYDLGYIEHFYDRLFSPKQQSTKSLLEIGIYHGHSIQLWRDYFVNADIHALDINYCAAVVNQPRIHPQFTNAYCIETVESLSDQQFDIIIDDGPHTLASLEFFCEHYIKLVKPGGIFVVEDIIDLSWTPRLLEILGAHRRTQVISMAGLARTTHLKNLWSKGLDVIIVEA
jgi:2-polyprenyl-3-methyl-5-hydroxy-6-metoxy-1,4-benzoquinol methylase